MPTVSVIIPTYNRAWALKRAIDSVLAQDFQDFELIVVDDGSVDNTSKILRSYSQICVVRQDHRGVSASRNTGIARTKGNLITFLDSDDLWLPKKLSAQVEFFNAHPDVLICQTEETWIRNGNHVNPKKRHKKPSGMIFERCLELCLVSPSAVMMRRCLFDKIGTFDETLPVCEDYDLWLRAACRFPIYLIESPLVIKHGGHPDQLSRRRGVDRFRIQALKKILETDFLSHSQYCAATAALRNKCAIYAAGCVKRGRANEANHYMRLSDRFTRQADSQLNSKEFMPQCTHLDNPSGMLP